jgi:hypothetical protein
MVYFDFSFVIDSLTVADLLFVIKNSREKRRKVGEGTGMKRNEMSRSNRMRKSRKVEEGQETLEGGR